VAPGSSPLSGGKANRQRPGCRGRRQDAPAPRGTDIPHAWLSCAVLLLGGACAAAFLVAPVDSGWQIGAWLVPYVAAAILLGVRARGAQPSIRGPLTVLLGGYLVYAGASADRT
jgi:hypothetical protein